MFFLTLFFIKLYYDIYIIISFQFFKFEIDGKLNFDIDTLHNRLKNKYIFLYIIIRKT
jgi:hypothetical protein